MKNFAIIHNFRFIDWKNQLVCSNNNKVVFSSLANFRTFHDKILCVIKRQHPSAVAIDFDYTVVESPYI
jgi:hypothetical protein